MRYKQILFVTAVILLSSCRSIGSWYGNTPLPVEKLKIDLNNGYQTERVLYNGIVYDIVIIDPKIISLHLVIDNRGKGIKISDLVNDIGKEKVLFVTNGGMFTKDRKALGYLSFKGESISQINLKDSDYGNFYLKPNGVFYIHNNNGNILETNKFKNQVIGKNITPYLATQSGPLLLENGNIHPAFNKGSKNKYIRNGVGIVSGKNHIVFAISNRPVNFYDFSLFFKEALSCRNALYLDGNISAMYIPELKREQYRGSFGPVIYATTD